MDIVGKSSSFEALGYELCIQWEVSQTTSYGYHK